MGSPFEQMEENWFLWVRVMKCWWRDLKWVVESLGWKGLESGEIRGEKWGFRGYEECLMKCQRKKRE